MQFDMEEASSSDDGQLLVALRNLMKKEVEVMVIRTVKQVIVPIFENLVRKVVKEEIQSVEQTLLARNANKVKERHLQLKFSDEVSDPVLTGGPLNGKGGSSLKVELVDRETGQLVETGPLSCAKVEILVLDASRDDNWTLENFNNRIIRQGDKERPHFSKNVYVCLKEGVAILSNIKLGHDSKWMKNCKCRLGARIIESFKRVNVEEATSESFTVVDCRSQQYKKHYPPSLSDDVWRLVNIGRDGEPCKRLKKAKIETVEDFLFLLSIDPHRLQKLVGAGAKWKATVDHALTCAKDDEKVYLHYPSSESKMGVIFDAVGGLKGIINDSHYVPINDLSADDKDTAHKLLVSAFENREGRSSFDDEASLVKQFPYRSSSDMISSPHSNGNCLSVSDYPVEEARILFQSNEAYTRPLDHPNPSTDTGQVCDDLDVPFPDPGTSNILHCGDPMVGQLHEHNWYVQSPSYEFDIEYLRRLIDSGSNNLSEPFCSQQSNAEAYCLDLPVAKIRLWVLRARKRVMNLGGIDARKKQKT